MKKGEVKKEKRKSKDDLAYLWQDILQSKKRYFWLVFFLIFINILSYVVVFYHTFFRTDKVILLDPTGKPYFAQAYSDSGIFKQELQHFFNTVVTIVYERTYVDFLDEQTRQSIIAALEPYFASKESLTNFLKVYFESPFVKSMVGNKYITKVGETSALDVKKDKEGQYRAVGRVKVSAYLENNVVYTQYRTIEVIFLKGQRTIKNPYGIYIIGFLEKETEEAR